MNATESKIPAFGREKRRSFLPSARKSYPPADLEDQGNSTPFILSHAPSSQGQVPSSQGHAPNTQGHAPNTQGHAHSTQSHSLSQPSHPSVPIGGRVCISGVKFGTLLYFGETHITGGLWCGIELDDPDGKHDGEVEGRRYFRCRPMHGIFAPLEKVQPAVLDRDPLVVTTAAGAGSGLLGGIPGKRPLERTLREPSEKVANVTFVKEAPLHTSTPERAPTAHSREFTLKPSPLVQDLSALQDPRKAKREDVGQAAAAPDREERGDHAVPQQSSSRFRGIPKLGGGAGIPKLKSERGPLSPEAVEKEQELEGERTQPKQSGLPVASRLPKFGRPSKGGPSSPGERASPRELSKTFSLGPLDNGAAQGEHSSSAEEGDPLSPDVKHQLRSDSRHYLNLTFDAEGRGSPASQVQNLPDVVSSVSSSPDSRASLSDRESESAPRLSHVTSSSAPDPMSSSGGQEFSSDLEHSDLMEGYEVDDEFAEPAHLGQLQAIRAGMGSAATEGVPEPRKAQPLHADSDSEEFGDELDRAGGQGRDDARAAGDYCHDDLKMTRALSSGTDPDSTLQFGSSSSLRSAATLGHSTSGGADTLWDSAPALDQETPPSAMLEMSRGDTFLLEDKAGPRDADSTEVDRADAVLDALPGGEVGVKLRVNAGAARRKGPMTDSGISEQGDLEEGEGAELPARPDVIMQAHSDDVQLAEDLRAGHARCDRPVSLLSTTSADTGYVPDADSEGGTLTANSPLDWSERGTTLHPRHPGARGEGGKAPQQTKAASPVNDALTEDDRTEADRDIVVESKVARQVVMATAPPLPLVSSTGTVMASSATESMISSLPPEPDPPTQAGQGEAEPGQLDQADDIRPEDGAPADANAAVEEDGDVEKPEQGDDEDDDQADDEEDAGETEKKGKPDGAEPSGTAATAAGGAGGKKASKKASLASMKHPMPNTKAAASRLADYIKAPPPPPKPKEDKAEETKAKKNVANKHKANAKADTDTSSAGDTSVERKTRVKVEKEVPKIIKRAPVKNKWDNIMAQIEANKEAPKPKAKEVKSTLAAYLSTPAPVVKKEREPKKDAKPRSVLHHNPIPDYSKIKSKLSSSIPPPPPRCQSPGPASRRHSQSSKAGIHLDLSSNLSSARSSHTDLSGAGDSLDNSGRSRTERASRNSISKGPAHLRHERSTSVASTRSDNSQAGSAVKAMNARNAQKSETARTEPPKPRKSQVKSSIPPPGETGVLGRAHGCSNPTCVLCYKKDQNRSRTVASKTPRASTAAPSTSNHVVKSSAPDVVSTARNARSQEVARLEALCETRTKELSLARLQLKEQSQGFDAMSVVVRYLNEQLDAFSCPLVKEKLKKAEQELENFREKTESLTQAKERLETELKTAQGQHQAALSESERLSGELTAAREAHEKSTAELQHGHEAQLSSQREHLLSCHKEELHMVQDKYERDVNHQRKSHERNLADMKLENQIATDNLRLQHLEDIQALRTKHDAQMEELHKQHRDKLEDITKRFESIKTTLGEKVDVLRGECDELRNRAKMSEEALLRDADVKVQMALEPYRHLPKEIESLKTVIEMRNDEIQKLRTRNMDLDKQLEELPIAREKIISLQQKVENLEAIVNIKSDHEKQLHEKCGNLMRKFDRESKANKRLSMDYEELLWRMSQSSELDKDSQENLSYRRQISHSPTGSESTSPVTTRRQLSSPANGDVSPRYNRKSMSGMDSLERKLKRRSQTFILEEKQGSASVGASPSHSPQPKRQSPQGLTGESPPPSLTVSYPGPSCHEPLPHGGESDMESDVFEHSGEVTVEEVTVSLTLPNGDQDSSVSELSQRDSKQSVQSGRGEKKQPSRDEDQQQKQQPKPGRSVVESDV